MSYMKYYAEKYNRAIKDPKQPLLISIPKVRHCLVCNFLISYFNFIRNCPVSEYFL